MKVEAASIGGASLGKLPPAAESIDRERKEASSLAPASDDKKIQPEEVLQRIKALTQDGAYSVRFELDDRTEQMIIHLVDAESGEELRQIPAEELLGVAERMRELRGNLLDATS